MTQGKNEEIITTEKEEKIQVGNKGSKDGRRTAGTDVGQKEME